MDIVTKTVQRFMGYPESVLTEDVDLVSELGADSITLNEILGALEAEYGIEEVPHEEVEKVRTIKEMKELVRKYTTST